MKSGSVALAAVLLASSALGGETLSMTDPQVGMITSDGHVFLYREPVEGFWNDWAGMRVNNPESKQANVYIEGSGKTANFHGVVSISCPRGYGHFWYTGAFGGGLQPATKAELKELVPKDVVVQARRFFCN